MAKILVPFDHSENAFIALKQALLIAKNNQVDIELFHVISLLVTRDYPMDWSESDLNEIKESLQLKIDAAKNALSGVEEIPVSIKLQRGEKVVDEVLLRASNTDVVLIVMGTHGVTGLIDKYLGTNSLDVISESKWPVLLIPPHWEEREIHELVVAAELDEFVSLTTTTKDIAHFFNLPVRAIQITGVIDTKDQTEKIIDGIPFKYISSDLENTLAKNLKEYTSTLSNSILCMYIHPRNFIQKFFGISFTEETAKLIHIPLLSVRKDI